MKNKIALLIISLGMRLVIEAQPVQLSLGQFLTQVKNNHPLSYIATLKTLDAKAVLQEKRGLFDPKLKLAIDDKFFENKNYYQNMLSSIHIPTWYGIEFKTQFEQNRGQFLNPENTTPSTGLLTAGISVPLGQDLLLDKRRADLLKSKENINLANFEKQLLLNDLLYEAALAYYYWQNSYKTVAIYTQAVQLAKLRFDAVKTENKSGNVPAIDTVEALIQLQNRYLSLQKAQLELSNNRLWLNTYLWLNPDTPAVMALLTLPDTLFTPLYIDVIKATDIENTLANHPLTGMYNSKITMQNIQIKLLRQNLLPNLRLNYQPLSRGLQTSNIQQYWGTNYKWGLQFEMPLFIRKERGLYKQAQIKQQNLTAYRSLETIKIKTKWQQNYNEVTNTAAQLQLARINVQNSFALFQAEKNKFFLGESSIFMVNSRENNYISAQLTQLDLELKNITSNLKLAYSLGTLPQLVK